MNKAVARALAHPQPDSRQEMLRRATSRRVRLERMFADQPYLDRLLAEGRYLRLCAAFAWACANEERAQAECDTDAMVARLRGARAADPA